MPAAEMKIASKYEKHLIAHSFVLCFTDTTLTNSRFFTFISYCMKISKLEFHVPEAVFRKKKTTNY